MNYEIIIDAGETPNKCTISPLRKRPDFRLIPVTQTGTLGPFSVPILLHHQGQCLTELRKQMPAPSGIGCVDCVWRRLDPILARIEAPLPVLARIPDGFKTAYPRKAETPDTDPDGGLATIEAIFVATALMGTWDVSLFSEYYFGTLFIEMNLDLFVALGVIDPNTPFEKPIFTPRNRSSLQRRKDRGRPVI